ncbi:class I tRNA ligase family protein [Pseudoalteromonas sp. ASV78]|uniref:class I tRNA ligase family protein n=1 Tax=Pseudoalteromonas sp. ASV78 TaxID=3397851 RepID=UPI0039FBE861
MKDKAYILMSAMPTPNGHIHLGHIGAQFLPMDVLKRHYHRKGLKAVTVNGFDVFDNSVLFSAQQENRDAVETVDEYVNAIKGDLEYLDIFQDCIINYLDDDHKQGFTDVVNEVDGLLAEYKVDVTAQFPFTVEQNIPVSGKWLNGICGYCGSKVSSFSCDACSRVLDAVHIKSPYCLTGEAMKWHQVPKEDLTISWASLTKYYAKLSIPETLSYLTEANQAEETFTIPWTTYDRWGISCGDNSKVFMHSNFTFIEQIYLGEKIKQQLGLALNPFDADSDTVNIFAYGKDNAGLLLRNIPALALATNKYRSFDHHHISHFFTLEGEKISTSRKHAIWVNDLKQDERFCVDAVRGYICKKYNLYQNTDISMLELHQYQQDFNQLHYQTVEQQLARISSLEGIFDEQLFNQLLEKQELALNYQQLDLTTVIECIEQWCHYAQSDATSINGVKWLKGYLILAAPVFTQLASKIDYCINEYSAPLSVN